MELFQGPRRGQQGQVFKILRNYSLSKACFTNISQWVCIGNQIPTFFATSSLGSLPDGGRQGMEAGKSVPFTEISRDGTGDKLKSADLESVGLGIRVWGE